MKDQGLKQQGDVLFFLVDKLPEALKAHIDPRPGHVTFAEGEVTGHYHACIADGVQAFEDESGTLYLSVEKSATVHHQEHGAVVLDPGKYRIGKVREVDPFEQAVRDVAD